MAMNRTFTIWKQTKWNHVCIIDNSKDDYNKVIINGEVVLKLDYQSVFVKTNDSLQVMGWLHHGSYLYSLFGQMTDINVWNRSFTYIACIFVLVFIIMCLIMRPHHHTHTIRDRWGNWSPVRKTWPNEHNQSKLWKAAQYLIFKSNNEFMDKII